MSIVGGLSSIWSLAAISVERHAVIAGGLSANKRRFSLRTVVATLATMWTASVVLMVGPMVGWNRYVYEVRIVHVFSVLVAKYSLVTEILH